MIVPPVSVTNPVVWLKPPRSKTPPLSVNTPVATSRSDAPKSSVPALSTVPSVYRLAALSRTVPVPFLVSTAAPASTVDTVPASTVNCVAARVPPERLPPVRLKAATAWSVVPSASMPPFTVRSPVNASALDTARPSVPSFNVVPPV